MKKMVLEAWELERATEGKGKNERPVRQEDKAFTAMGQS